MPDYMIKYARPDPAHIVEALQAGALHAWLAPAG
jgi:hypothetical protein